MDIALNVATPWWAVKTRAPAVFRRKAMPDTGSDAAVLRRMADGDEGALVVLWSRHASSLLSYLVAVTGDSDLAEEIVQDAMLAAWRAATRFRGDAEVRTWLFAIARRQASGRVRRLRADRDMLIGDDVLANRAAIEPGPEAVALARAELSAVSQAVAGLSPLHREVLHLVFAEGLGMHETAAVLAVPVGTVKSRLSNARRALAAAIAESGPEQIGSLP